MKKIFVLSLFFILLTGFASAHMYDAGDAGYYAPMMDMMGWWSAPFGLNSNNTMMGFGFGILGLVFMVFWWALIIAVVVALVRWLRGTSGRRMADHDKSPLEILKERYARGEIDKSEFEEKKKDLL